MGQKGTSRLSSVRELNWEGLVPKRIHFDEVNPNCFGVAAKQCQIS
jgi:hypothetical protein